MSVAEETSAADELEIPTWQLLVVGVIGGVLSGLLGIGGGTVMVPLLALWLGMSQRTAHAVSLGAIVPISAVAITAYGLAGEVNWPLAAALIIGSMLGARVGAGLLSRLGESTLKSLFGGFLLLAATMIALKP